MGVVADTWSCAAAGRGLCRTPRRGAGGGVLCRPGCAEITSPGRRRIERAVRLVVLNVFRRGQQVAVVLRYYTARSTSSPANPRMASIDGHQLNVMTSAAFVVQIANGNQRAEIAWRRTVFGQASVADVGDVFIGQLSAKLAPPFSKDCHSHCDSMGFRSVSRRSATRTAEPVKTTLSEAQHRTTTATMIGSSTTPSPHP